MTILDEDTLISMICVGEARDADWEAFEQLAAAAPGLWRDLAEAQRDQSALSAAVAAVVAAADRTDLGPAQSSSFNIARNASEAAFRWPRAWSWGGWAAAALVAVAWSIGFGQVPPAPFVPASTAGFDLASLSSDDLLQTYLDKGRASGEVIGEVPAKVLIGARPARTGEGYDLLYLRQMIEQTQVPELYRFGGQDEQGRATLVRYSPHIRRPL